MVVAPSTLRVARVVASLAVLVGLASCHTFPDDPSPTRWPSEPSIPNVTFLSGRIVIRGTTTPIEGAVVSSSHTSTSSTTDATGYYALDGIRSIHTLLEVTKAGFDTLRIGTQLVPSQMTFNLTMVRSP